MTEKKTHEKACHELCASEIARGVEVTLHFRHRHELFSRFSHRSLREAFSDSLIMYTLWKSPPFVGGCMRARWTFMLYFQTAADVDGHRGQITRTLVQGKFVRSVAAAE